jgi:choline transport protein
MEGLQTSEKLPEAQLGQSEAEAGQSSDIVNTSGHKQELDRNFGLWSICALSVCTDNAWAAGGGSLVRLRYSRLSGKLYIG